MKTINAEKFGILPEKDITKNLIDLIDSVAKTDEKQTVVFQRGTYYISSEKCRQHMLYITNTAGEKEFKSGEKPHLNAVPFYFENISNLVFDCNDSVFVIDGKVTAMAFENCSDITVKNLELRYKSPDMHELNVVKKTPFSVDFEIDCDSSYEVKSNKLTFVGKDYNLSSDKSILKATWIGLIRKDTPEKIERVLHPLATYIAIRDLGKRKIRVTFPATFRYKLGDRFYIYDVRRQFAGIFVNRCKNTNFQNVKQRFNYSLSFVAQDSENIAAEELDFSPEKGSARKVASVADFVQLCMCRGKIEIKNSRFVGAGDDCLNVHGVHFKIVGKSLNEITVRFMHPQTFGFNPLRVGDTVAFIDPDTLLQSKTAVIKKSKLIDAYNIVLTLDDSTGAAVGNVIEDIDACPELNFENNFVSRIITRGLLITTRKKVNIENNRFVSTSMSGILLSDDAKSWYESGMCRDVTIKNNTFDYCGQTPILIKPENSRHDGAVHKNISVIGNAFKGYSGYCVEAKSTDNISLKGNSFLSEKKIKAKNCKNVTCEN